MPKEHPEFSTEKGFLVTDDTHRGLSFGLMTAATYDEASNFRDDVHDRIQNGIGLTMSMLLPGGTYRFGDGSVTAPSVSWALDTDTGRYRIAAGNPAESADGVLIYDWTTSRVKFSKQVQFTDGTAAAPGWTFYSDAGTNTGAYLIGANNIGFSADGTLQWDYNTTRLFSTDQAIYMGVDAAIIANTFLSIDKTVNASLRITMRNNSALGNATCGIYLINDNLNKGVELGVTGTGFTAIGNFVANEAFIACDTGIPLLIAIPSGQGLRVATGGTVRWTLSSTGMLTWTGTASSSGSPTMLSMTAPAHTALAADTESSDVNFNLARTVEFTAGGGAFTNQRAFKILAPTYAATAAETITNAATLYVDAAPTGGTNMTLTNSYAAWFDAGTVRVDGTLNAQGALDHDGSTVGLYGVTPVAQSSAYTATNVTTDRSYDADATTLAEIADVLGTLIADLKLTGIIG